MLAEARRTMTRHYYPTPGSRVFATILHEKRMHGYTMMKLSERLEEATVIKSWGCTRRCGNYFDKYTTLYGSREFCVLM